MHTDQIDTDSALVRRLLAEQFPKWADLPVEPVQSYGTDHDIYRVGDRLAVRLPIIAWATGQAAKEARWLSELATQLPLSIPLQLERGWLPPDTPSSGQYMNGCQARTPTAQSATSTKQLLR